MFRGLVVSGDRWFSSSDYARHQDNWPPTTDPYLGGTPLACTMAQCQS